MNDTTYRPPTSIKSRVPPTEQPDKLPTDSPFVLVHDPRSRALGGVAGHAGVFSTGDDVARWAQMLINGGVGANCKRILRESTVRQMLTERALPDGRQGRGLGVDINSGYAPAARGGRFEPHTTFGHTGYTGTCFWADPVNKCFYVLLTNRVYPDDKADLKRLRREVSTACAEAFLGAAPATQPAAMSHETKPDVAGVLCGIDVLVKDNFAALKGKRVGLITNHTGRDRQGRRTIDLLFNAPDVKLVALFSPEHGIEGKLDEKIGDVIEPKTGLKVNSLYGKINRPTKEMLQGVDALVFDIQDIGARFYTYSATLGLCMRSAGESNIPFFVLDRPNPITGLIVEGPIADKEHFGFTAFGPLPVAHGMTFGELAKLYNDEPAFKTQCELNVIECQGLTRKMWWDQTGLEWINPSPNMRSLNAALLYPGVCLMEQTNVSMGRGTDTPFEHFGAPWIDADRYAEALNAANLPGLHFEPTTFTPDASKFKGEPCHGVKITVTDRNAVQPVRAGTYMIWHLHKLFGQKFQLAKVDVLLKNKAALEALKTADDPEQVIAGWQPPLGEFKATREKYLIYE